MALCHTEKGTKWAPAGPKPGRLDPGSPRATISKPQGANTACDAACLRAPWGLVTADLFFHPR